MLRMDYIYKIILRLLCFNIIYVFFFPLDPVLAGVLGSVTVTFGCATDAVLGGGVALGCGVSATDVVLGGPFCWTRACNGGVGTMDFVDANGGEGVDTWIVACNVAVVVLEDELDEELEDEELKDEELDEELEDEELDEEREVNCDDGGDKDCESLYCCLICFLKSLEIGRASCRERV